MRKALSVLLDVLFPLWIFGCLLAPEWFGGGSCLWVFMGFFVVRAVLAFWPLFFTRPFIEIGDDWVVLDGVKCRREDIHSGRVFSARVNGVMGRYLEVALERRPSYPLWFRVRQFFMDSGFPLRCAQGIPLAKHPRIILPMGDTPLSDESIRRALSIDESSSN